MDEAATQNAFIGIRLRRSDPRIRKPPRKIRIWSFEQMCAFAAGGRPEVRAVTPRPRDPRRSGVPWTLNGLIETSGFELVAQR